MARSITMSGGTASIGPGTGRTPSQVADLVRGTGMDPFGGLARSRFAREQGRRNRANAPIFTAGSPTPHLDTAQSKRGRPSTPASSRTAVSAGGLPPLPPRPVFRRNRGVSPSITGTSGNLTLQRLMNELVGGSTGQLAGIGGTNPLYSTRASSVAATADAAEAEEIAQDEPTLEDFIDAIELQALMEQLERDRFTEQTNPDALALLKELIDRGASPEAQRATGRSEAAQQSALRTMAQLEGILRGGAGNAALERIRRQATEEGLASITRQAEAAGSSQSALASLLENDLMARMVEAQAAADLEARLGAAQALTGTYGQFPSLYINPAQQELEALLGYGSRLPVLAKHPGNQGQNSMRRSVSQLLSQYA